MPYSPLSDRRGRILLSEKRPERHFAAAPAFSCRLPPCGVFCTTDGFAGPFPFLSPGGIPPGDKNLKKGQLKGIAPGIGSRYNRRCISAERSKRQIPICNFVVITGSLKISITLRFLCISSFEKETLRAGSK